MKAAQDDADAANAALTKAVNDGAEAKTAAEQEVAETNGKVPMSQSTLNNA